MLTNEATPWQPSPGGPFDRLTEMVGGDLLDQRYKLLTILDVGGLGIVVKAKDEIIGREVAIKFLRPEHCEHIQFRKAFQREAQQAGLVDRHEHIVSLHDAKLTSDPPYLVLELVNGPSLEEVCRTRPSADRAVDIAAAILRALAYAHDRAVMHGDLKPRNVLLTEQGRVKVLDFGFAFSVAPAEGAANEEVRRVFARTDRYAAPEYIVSKEATVKSDIYAFGVLFHELLTGGEHPYRLEREVLTDDLSLASSIEPRLRAVIQRCIARDPEDRFSSVLEILQALVGADLPEPVSELPAETFYGRCLVCGENMGAFGWAPATRLCGRRGCVQPHLFRGAGASSETLLVSVAPEWVERLEVVALPSIDGPSSDLLALRSDRVLAPRIKNEAVDLLAKWLPYKQDFLAEVCGARCGNALCYRLPRISYAAHLEEVFVLDFSTYKWSGTLKDPRSWAIVNVALERGVQHLAAWTAGNAGLSLARICQLVNHWLPRERRLHCYALHGPSDELDDSIRFQLLQAGCTVIETASDEVFTPGMIERNVRLHAEADGSWSRDRFWDVSDGWEGVGLIMYRLIMAQVLRDLAAEVVVVPIGTGNLAIGTVLAAEDVGRNGGRVSVFGVAPQGDNVRQQIEALMQTAVRRTTYDPSRPRPLMPKLESTYTPLLACIDHFCRRQQLEIIEVDRRQQENALSNLYRVRMPWIAAEPSSVAAFAAITEVKRRRGKGRVLVVNTGCGVLSRREQEFMRPFL